MIPHLKLWANGGPTLLTKELFEGAHFVLKAPEGLYFLLFSQLPNDYSTLQTTSLIDSFTSHKKCEDEHRIEATRGFLSYPDRSASMIAFWDKLIPFPQ